jgi:hypothetical protein
LNPSRLLPQYDCCLISVPTTYWDASTLVQVTEFVNPEALIEANALAVL